MGNCIRHSGNVTVLSTAIRLSRGSGGPSYRSYDDLSPVANCESFHVEVEETPTVSQTSTKSRGSKILSRARKLKIRGLLKSNKGVSDLHGTAVEVPQILVTNPDGVCRKATSTVSDENQNVSHFVSYTQIDIPEVSLGSYLLRQFDLHGDQVAVIDPQNDENYRYRDMADRTRRVASALWKRGFRQGYTLCLVVPRNSIEVAPVMCATWCSGGICAILDPDASIEVLSRRIREVHPRVLVTDASLADRLLRATSMAGILTEIYTIGHVIGFHPLTELHSDSGSGFPSGIKLQPRMTCALILYSCDKAYPRAVQLSHYNVLSNVLQVQTTLCVKRGSTLGCFISLTDHFGLIASLLCGFASGAKVILVQKATMEHCVTAMIKYKPRRIHLSSEMANTMFLDEMMTLCDLSQLEAVLCGTSPLSAEVQRTIANKIGDAKVYQAHGSPETLITHCGCPLTPSPNGSCGSLVPNTICKILDQSTSTPLYTDATGEIWVNGPQCMMGYLSDQAAGGRPNEEWLFTENIGHVDSVGNFFIDGTCKPH